MPPLTLPGSHPGVSPAQHPARERDLLGAGGCRGDLRGIREEERGLHPSAGGVPQLPGPRRAPGGDWQAQPWRGAVRGLKHMTLLRSQLTQGRK